MSDFLKIASQPAQPEMMIYELDKCEPVASIDRMGQFWIKPAAGSSGLPKILFADVPTIIHTVFNFSIAPMEDANDQTGPERWRGPRGGVLVPESEQREGFGGIV